MNFEQACLETWDNPEYRQNWLRLKGHRMPRNAIEAMVDKSTGYQDSIFAEFVEDFAELVWLRLPDEAFAS